MGATPNSAIHSHAASCTYVLVGMDDSDRMIDRLRSAGAQHVVTQAPTDNREATVYCVNFAAGQDHLRAVRAKNRSAVVLAVLPPNAASETVQAALAAGADDFVMNSASAEEILLRTAARTQLNPQRAGAMTIEPEGRVIKGDKGSKFLSPIDFRIIQLLVSALGNVVTREKIKAECWPSTEVSDNAMNRKIHEVRRIIASVCPQLTIRTVYGLGFALVDNPKNS